LYHNINGFVIKNIFLNLLWKGFIESASDDKYFQRTLAKGKCSGKYKWTPATSSLVELLPLEQNGNTFFDFYEEHVLLGLNQVYYVYKCATCHHYKNIIKQFN
jgi:hypothetical protein